VSPRLPSGALLAATVATTAAVAVTAAVPALAATGTPAAPVGTTAKADKIRDSEWWLSSLHVTQAWQSSRGSGITVALLSTGVLTTHPDLDGSVTTGPDYTGSGETSASSGWGIEGTSAASIIAGHGDNTGDASGIIGIAPAARILSVRVAFDAADPLNASPTDVGRLPDAIA
jgi:subtilisin family serine protease